MTLEKIKAAYPHCIHAIAWLETIICIPSDEEPGESAWDLMMAARPSMNPRKVLEMLREVAEEELADTGVNEIVMDVVCAEIRHPSFLAYIAGKMGAV